MDRLQRGRAAKRLSPFRTDRVTPGGCPALFAARVLQHAMEETLRLATRRLHGKQSHDYTLEGSPAMIRFFWISPKVDRLPQIARGPT
jgi:hypothetical protein